MMNVTVCVIDCSHEQVYNSGLSHLVAQRLKLLKQGSVRITKSSSDEALENDESRMIAYRHVEEFALKHFQVDELSDEARTLLVRSLQKESFPGGTEMIKQGSMGDKLYVLVEGSVEFKKYDGKSDKLLGKGNAPILFGELSLIYNSERSTSVHVSNARIRAYPPPLVRPRLSRFEFLPPGSIRRLPRPLVLSSR
jgi:hypothetical protein